MPASTEGQRSQPKPAASTGPHEPLAAAKTGRPAGAACARCSSAGDGKRTSRWGPCHDGGAPPRRRQWRLRCARRKAGCAGQGGVRPPASRANLVASSTGGGAGGSRQRVPLENPTGRGVGGGGRGDRDGRRLSATPPPPSFPQPRPQACRRASREARPPARGATHRGPAPRRRAPTATANQGTRPVGSTSTTAAAARTTRSAGGPLACGRRRADRPPAAREGLHVARRARRAAAAAAGRAAAARPRDTTTGRLVPVSGARRLARRGSAVAAAGGPRRHGRRRGA